MATTASSSFLRQLAESDDGSATTKLTKVVVTMLPFSLKLDISNDENDRLLSSTNPQLFQEEEEVQEVHRKTVQDVDLSTLKARMSSYLNGVFEESLSASDSVYSPFATTVLTLTSYATSFGNGRKLEGEDMMMPVLGELEEEMSVGDLEWEVLEEVDLDAVLNRNVEMEEEEEGTMSMDVTRKTAEAQTVTATFTSLAIFTKDGDLPIPDNNQVAAIQISAFQENKKADMLAALQGDQTDPDDLLQYAKSATATISVNNDSDNIPPTTSPNPGTNNGGGNNDQGLDTVILIAVIVAAMSLFLLAIGIFIAWRRKVKTQTQYRSHHHNHHYSTSSATAKNITNEPAIPTTLQTKPRRDRNSTKEQAAAHPAPPSESDMSVSDLGTTTTIGNADQNIMNPRGNMVDEDVVPPPQTRNSKVLGGFRGFGKGKYARNTNRGTPTADIIDPTPSGLDPPSSSPASGGIYPEAVVNDDIESSLQDYYRSGLASHGNASTAGGSTLAGESTLAGSSAAGGRRTVPGSDVSVSSMESYGYSLDGYASSVAQSTQYGY